MATREQTVANLIEASGGTIIGRIRFQKMFYLFEQLGLKGAFPFVYHHYGPYSETLAISAQRAALIDKSVRERDVISEFGGRYSEFSLLRPSQPKFVGELSFDVAQRLAARMKQETSVVIELAATIHWLRHKEMTSDWNSELRRRKPSKSTAENIGKATALLSDLKLNA